MPSSGDPGLQYKIDENPSWLLSIFLGFQHYLTMFGSTVAVPFMLKEKLCLSDDPLSFAVIINTMFFVSGIVTLLQSYLGIRLPIIQGATFAFITPTTAILSLPQFKCPDITSNSGNNTTVSHDWKKGMLEIQGAIMVSSLFQVFIGFSGLVGLVSRFVGPLTVAPTIALIGLALFSDATLFVGQQWGIASTTVFLILMFSQVLKDFKVPFPWIGQGRTLKIVRLSIFKLFPILLAIVISWGISAIVTAAGGFSSNPTARTDARISVLKDSEWFYVPHPGQWGIPTVSLAGVFGMLAGVLASMIESIGDYYACARLSGAPPPPKHAMNRGIGIEGIGCLIAGACGSGNGTTSYGENIAAIGITKVASRRVVQVGAVIMILLGILGKVGAVFATIPEPIIGGMFWGLFGMILAVGLSNLQYVDLNSSRNLFVLGFSFFTGMMIPDWVGKNETAIDTGLVEIDQLIRVILTTEMAVGCIFALILDNALPGTLEERGIDRWRQLEDSAVGEQGKSTVSLHVYDPISSNLWSKKEMVEVYPIPAVLPK